MAKESSTSIKALIQGMIPDSSEIMQGVVISASPLKIQMANDEKLVISERITVVPRHLSDYTVSAVFSADDGVKSGKLTVQNSLKVGEKIYVLSLNNGKLYYVLDRTVV